jgi:hypothetical protein
MEELPSVVPVKPVFTKVDPFFFVILETLAILTSFRMNPHYLPVRLTEKCQSFPTFFIGNPFCQFLYNYHCPFAETAGQ